MTDFPTAIVLVALAFVFEGLAKAIIGLGLLTIAFTQNGHNLTFRELRLPHP